MSTNDVAVVRNGTRYEVWIGLRLLSTHSSIDAARTSARQIGSGYPWVPFLIPRVTEAEWGLRRHHGGQPDMTDTEYPDDEGLVVLLRNEIDQLRARAEKAEADLAVQLHPDEDIIQGAIDEWATIAGGPHADAGEQVTLAHYIASKLAEA